MNASVTEKIFPFVRWARGYGVSDLKADAIAGITVALVLIPQSMAYAQLAGLPVYYGLYASFLPPMVAALFGSSRRLATGPVAVVSMMTAASLEPLAIAGSEAYFAYAVLLAFVVGLFQFMLGVLRLGVIVSLLSHPVVSGFTNAAALIIASSQLAKFFGVHVDKAEHYYQTMGRVVEAAMHQMHWPTFAMGMLALAIMIVLKRFRPRWPCILVAVLITTVLSWAMGFEKNEVVDISAIKMPELPAMIERLNFNLNHIVEVRSVRAEITRNGTGRSSGDKKKLCSSCHPDHMVDMEQLKQNVTVRTDEAIPLAKVLELHVMAGVLDQFLAQEKEFTVQLRKKLRGLRFVLVRDDATGQKYYIEERNSPAPGSGEDRRQWRLKIGSKPLDPHHLVLVGGGEVVGAVPSGLPRFSMPRFDFTILPRLAAAAVIISFLGFMEAISIAKSIAARTGCRLDPNQELMGQGLANMTGSFFGSYPVSGSFSRSAVNFQAGARTGFASAITTLAVTLVLLFCTPLLYHLPQAVLAAIIMMAVAGLINTREIRHAFLVKRSDGVIAIVTFAATLFFAPHLDRGILLGVGLSVAMFFYNRMKPVIAELSRWKDGHFRDVRHFHLKQCRYIAVIRFDGPLFFANISYLEDEVLKIVDAMPELRIVHFKANGINDIDTSGDHALLLLVDRLHAGGYDVYFSGLKEHIVETMRRTGLLNKIGEDHIFPTLAVALDAYWSSVHKPEEEASCPLKRVVFKQPDDGHKNNPER